MQKSSSSCSSTKECKTGLFLTCYEIGAVGVPGAPVLKTCLTVCTPQETISGAGSVTQAVNPPVDIQTIITGQYTYMTVMPNTSKILVIAEGYPPVKFPSGAGIGPVILPNVQLRMVLDECWEKGVAEFKFCDASGCWHEVKNVPVKSIPSSSFALNAAA